jgi:negative regulator of sigma E activity
VLRRSRSCYVLQSVNPDAKPGGYGWVITWIDQETNQPIQAEAYGTDGKILKEFSIGSIKKVNGRWELKDMKISNRRTGTQTQLEFNLEVKPPPGQ